ncbi:Bifunctional transcriptional activator/DNA repair enzyme AdaA [compost metagenome]
METILRASLGSNVPQATERINHNEAGLGNLTVTGYSLNGVEIFDVKICDGVRGAYYPQHIVTLFESPYVMDGRWQGHRLNTAWNRGNVLFIPAESVLTFDAHTPYNETVIRLKGELFERAARDHIDFSQIDFTFHDVTSQATWNMGMGLAGIVKDVEYREWPLLVESASISLVLAVIRELSPNSTTAFKAIQYGISQMRRRRVLSYIDDNISRQITLAELAEVANLSIYHFCRKFKNGMGMTPLQYISFRRVEFAKQMLRSTKDSLVTIALACGFCSQSHFCTVFKAVTGVKPSVYRNSGE